MEHQEKYKSKKSRGSAILNIAAIITALIAIALLVNNVIFYIYTLNQYLAQGYPASAVMSQLVPSQLLPGIFEPVALYGGIACALFGINAINKKSSECLALLNKTRDCGSAALESIPGGNVIDTEDISGDKS